MGIDLDRAYKNDLSVVELGRLHADQMAAWRKQAALARKAAMLAGRAQAKEEAEESRRERQLAEQALRLDMSTRSHPMPGDAGLIIDTVVLATNIDAAAYALQVHPATLLEWMDQPGNAEHVATIHRRRARLAAFAWRAIGSDELVDYQSRGIALKAAVLEAQAMGRSEYGPAAVPLAGNQTVVITGGLPDA